MATIRYWAAARAAAGTGDERYDASSLAELVAAVKAAHSGDGLPKVLDRCSWVVDEAPVGGRAHDTVTLRADSVAEALPPFAGGAGPGSTQRFDPPGARLPVRTGPG